MKGSVSFLSRQKQKKTKQKPDVKIFLKSVRRRKNFQNNSIRVFTWLNYFSWGIFHHNLACIKVLKCELKATQGFNKSNLVGHVQIISISLEHLGERGRRAGLGVCFYHLALECFIHKLAIFRNHTGFFKLLSQVNCAVSTVFQTKLII